MPPGIPQPNGHPITMLSKVFEEKTAKDFQYDGVTKGASWRSDVFDYFISKCPYGQPWLEWAERMGANEITPVLIAEEKKKLGTALDPEVFSHHVWGFLQHCVSGAARQTFKNTQKRDGLNVWRALVLEVNSQTACRRHGLRDRVQMQSQVESNEQVRQAIANWESAYNEYREAGGDEMDVEDRRSQLLRILPTQLRRDLFRKLDEFKNPKTAIAEMKEWIRVQTEMEREWRLDDQLRRGRARPVNTVEAEPIDEGGELPTEDDMNALFALGTTSTMAEILAIQRRFQKFGGRGAPRRQAMAAAPAGLRGRGAPDAAPGRLPGAAQAGSSPSGPEKCVNCGRSNHATRDCREPRREKHERPCWWCQEVGHFARNCPHAKKPPTKVLEAPEAARVVHFGCIAVEEAGEWTTSRKTTKVL